jgi:predicted neuraminidase
MTQGVRRWTCKRWVLYAASVWAAIVNASAAAGFEIEGERVVAEFCFESAPFASCHASSIVETQTGELLVTYFAGSDEGEKDVGIWLSRGKNQPDHSTVWEKPQRVHQEPNTPCWNPVLFRTKKDEVLLFFKAGPSPREWSGFVRRSTDGGKTWSEPELLPAGILGPVRSKPIELDDGRIVCGSSVESYRAWTCWVESTPDTGRSWTKHGPISVPGHPYGIIQPSVFPTAEGGVGFLARSRGIGKIVRSESKDGGRTWTPARPIDLPNPNAGVDAVRLRDGRLALIYNHSVTSRTPLKIAVSSDDGLTFTEKLVLEDARGEYSYPAMIQTEDGRVHCTYTWQRKRIKHVSVDPSNW